MGCLAFDTSNYTTSTAYYDGTAAFDRARLLDVEEGKLGLRQSDALFSHVKRLPELMTQLMSDCDGYPITAVAASTRPRAVEGSYMPCFLAGQSQAQSIASVLGVPFFAVSHQQGHLAAALWSAQRMNLMEQSFLAWHLSGGTTELLLVHGDGKTLSAQKIGGTKDLSAGQLIDRTGRLLGVPFPAGKELDRLAGEELPAVKAFRVRLDGLYFSFSGLENQVSGAYRQGMSREETAAVALRSICQAVHQATEAALLAYPGVPVVFSGGVSSNRMLRRMCSDLDTVFAQPRFATDNAMGVAVLGWGMEAAR
jgi:N6-L-threonylcarbamoyladenine synthase